MSEQLYAKTPDQSIRTAIISRGGLSRDIPVLSRGLARSLMECYPFLTEESVKELFAKYADMAAQYRSQVEVEDYVVMTKV